VRMNRPSQRVQVPAVHPHPVRSLDRHPGPDRDPSHDHVLGLIRQVPIGVAVAADMVAAVPAAVRVIVVMVRSEQQVCILQWTLSGIVCTVSLSG
jgi:hypothetical protein